MDQLVTSPEGRSGDGKGKFFKEDQLPSGWLVDTASGSDKHRLRAWPFSVEVTCSSIS
jgi:hypothetical protein